MPGFFVVCDDGSTLQHNAAPALFETQKDARIALTLRGIPGPAGIYSEPGPDGRAALVDAVYLPFRPMVVTLPGSYIPRQLR